MLQKIFSFFIILVVVYLISIFQFPNIASAIEQLFGVVGLGDFLIYFKNILYDIFTYFPSKEEFENIYQTTMSGAEVVKGQVIDGLGQAKDHIDSIRISLSGAEDTYNTTKDLINSSSGKINEVIDIIGKIQDISASGVTSTGNIVK